jgi:alpha-galactosidase
MKPGAAAKVCDVKLDGVQSVLLQTGDAGDDNLYDHADWADAKFVTAPGAKLVAGDDLPAVAPYILTPPAPAAPRINGAKVFGVRPGSPFLYTIPATGERPMTFFVENAPSLLCVETNGVRPSGNNCRFCEGMLILNPTNGQLSGSIAVKGEYTLTLCAKNSSGVARKSFRIVVGDTIALTPPMGWNSWNCFAGAVSAEKVKAAADAFVRAGLINHGWSYINVDDFWQNHRNSKDATLRGEFRTASGEIQPNTRFPDMKGLADYIHALGLKAGLYSSPGPWTCGGCAGSWQHEQQDALTYAAWGFDYLKYDWCSYGNAALLPNTNAFAVKFYGKITDEEAAAQLPYAVMGKFLTAQKRDIVFSLCQYGMADVWRWGASVNGTCWRTTGDINDSWRSMSGIGFRQDAAAPFAGPGHWNDPDMLVVGEVGWGPKLHPTKLTPDEQYTHISLWCLLAAPLLIGCDLEKLDDFTLSLLTNDEVLALDQDSLGQQATCVSSNASLRVYAKDLDDGGKAVGLFNLGNTPAQATANWNELKLFGARTVRDLWRQKDLGKFDKEFSATVPPHGVVLVKLNSLGGGKAKANVKPTSTPPNP